MKRVLFGLLALGCAPPEPMTEARISSTFTADEISIWISSVDEWCSVSADACFRVSVTSPRDANVVKLRDPPSGWVAGKCGAHAPESGRIEFMESCQLDMPLALHELGHALRQARGHLHEEGAIMSGIALPNLDCLTDRDAKFVCESRGCAEWRGTCPGGK